MNAQDLKNSILQLAIQGKLVEQRKEEGTAKELLEKIEAEKKHLIKEGKIKKQKELPEIKVDEIPFDIPESWEWVRLSEIIDVRDGTHDTPKYVTNGVPLVTSKNLKQGEIDFDNVKLISIEDSEKINMRSGVDDGDILFAMIGSIGNPVLVNKTRDFSIKNMALFKPIKNTLFNMEYLLNYLQLEQESMKRKAAGGVQSFVSLTFLRQYLFPLPPLEEQKRIVAKIEELMPYVDKYDVAYSEVEKLNKKFPEDMQKSILQYAIQGKLVEQREEDGTAEELYIEIQAEKEKLIREGKIKKSNPLPEITEDEIPFDIPENWKWVRLEQVCEYIQRGKSPKYSDVKKYPVVAQKCNQWSGFSLEKAKFIDPKTLGSYTEDRILKDGDLMWNSTGLGTLGRVAIYEVDKNPYELAVADSHVTVIRPLKQYVNFKYLYYYIANPSVQSIIEKQSYGSTKQIELATDTVKNYIFPLPPVKEQKRIVEKIEELLPYTKQLAKKPD